MPENATVATPSPTYQRMSARWPLIDALLGGTDAMRAAREKFLPKHEAETPKGYESRLAKGFLYEALQDAVERVVAKPFSKDVVIKGTIPEVLEPMRDNVDQRGRNFTQFARDLFDDGVSYGLSHVLVDFPKNASSLNLGAQRRLKLRPYFTHIKHSDLRGHRFEETDLGQTRLRQIRIAECRMVDDGDYGEKEVQYIRVINAPLLSNETGEPIPRTGTWELHEKVGNGDTEADWKKIEEGPHSFPGIPLVTFYAKRKGHLEAEIPFRKLASLNLAHWQSSTDQRNILSVARVGILFAAGFTKKELEGGITIGPNNYIFSTNEKATMKYVEHTGAAIGAGRIDLEDLKAEMAALSLQPLLQRTGNQTATGKALDDAKGESVAQSWVRALENTLYEALGYAAMWISETLPDDVSIDVYNDFGLSQRAIEDLRALGEAYDRKTISSKTYLEELQRRGVLREDLDIEQELEDAASEEPRVPFVGTEPGNDGIKDDETDAETDDQMSDDAEHQSENP